MDKWSSRFLVSVGCACASLFILSRVTGEWSIETVFGLLSSLTYAIYAGVVLVKGVD